MNVNKLILGDNLDIMKKMDSESVDLVYLDPPFFSNRNYEVIWGDAGEIRSSRPPQPALDRHRPVVNGC